ncbi:hypothetical protein TNCV_2409681 [Trichonephila clavipes]|nr:hypothetical protein TNCV_2409681 [Trichonephila clavipes]
MYNLFRHSKKQSYIQRTFLPSASSRDPQNRFSRMSSLDKSIRNVGERNSWKPFSPLPQAATPFASCLRYNQMVPEQHSPQTPPFSRENFFR